MRSPSPEGTAAAVLHEADVRGLVSVVLPTYFGADRILGSIESVQAQTYRQWELIVVIDASTDATEALVTGLNDPRIRCEVLTTNVGPFGAMNAGIAMARGEFTAFLDDDDRWMPEKLASQVARMAANSELGLVHTGALDVFEDGRRLVRLPPRRANLFDRNLISDCVCNTSVLVRRSVFERIGVFDPGLRGFGDWDLWIRLLRTYEAESLSTPLVVVNQRSASVMHGNVSRLARDRSRVLRRHWQSLRARGLRRAALSHHEAYLGGLYLVAGDQRPARRRALRALKLKLTARALVTYWLSFAPQPIVRAAWHGLQRLRRGVRA